MFFMVLINHDMIWNLSLGQQFLHRIRANSIQKSLCPMASEYKPIYLTETHLLIVAFKCKNVLTKRKVYKLTSR